MSSNATIKVATALIEEYQATIDQINSLKVQIESVRSEKLVIEERNKGIFASLNYEIEGLNARIE